MSDHPLILALLLAGGLALILIPLAMVVAERLARKDRPPDRPDDPDR